MTSSKGSVAFLQVAEGMPVEVPGPMPPQPLDWFDERSRRRPVNPWGARAARWRRMVVLGASVALAAYATNELRLALSVGRPTLLPTLVLLLFAVNISWISLPFVTSLAGFVRHLGQRRAPPAAGAPLSTRTALLMPTYNEDPARVAAALDAMAHELVGLGEGHAFDIFLLSDTTRADIALGEEEAVLALRRRLGHAIRVYYRRRRDNTAHKSGNLHDFCTRWGGAYDHLLMLDADSLIEGATLVALAQRMESDPDAGLIQSLPHLHRGTTLMARVQAFASRVYGGMLTGGLTWWTGREASFWGHNAILRTRAFMDAAGLPVLPGKPPFGGPILSHDFVEAALIRRAGWGVSIADDLEGSFEECPSSLIDLAIRDRRWCQGNLQHLRVIRAKGLHWVSRLHLAAGVMSYLSATFWLLFVLAALALGVQYEVARQQYFGPTSTLFPLWPRIDPVRAIRLFGVTMVILFGPKTLGFLTTLADPRLRRASGGAVRLTVGFLLEVVLSALIAPVMALIHVGLVLDILRGKSSGWKPQQREGGSVPWSQVLYRHRWHMVAGVALAIVGDAISWQMLAWLSPAVVGMVLAAPVSKLTASVAVGERVERLGLLRTPEETAPPAISLAAEAAFPVYRDAVSAAPSLAEIVSSPELLARHLALTDRPPPPPPGHVHPVEAVAEKKIRDAGNVEEALARLTIEERARVQALPELLHVLAGQPRRPEEAAGAAPASAHQPGAPC